MLRDLQAPRKNLAWSSEVVMDRRADDIIIQTESPGAPRTLFRIAIGDKIIAEDMTVGQAYMLAGDILERLVRPTLLRRRSLLSRLNEASPYVRGRRKV
jgi:hypothetical protein